MLSEIDLGSERSIALQVSLAAGEDDLFAVISPPSKKDSIQKQLAMKGYSQEEDTVMAEYITIMLANDKTPEQVTSELTELIGDYDPSFTDWLFSEKNNPDLNSLPSGAPGDDADESSPAQPEDPPSLGIAAGQAAAHPNSTTSTTRSQPLQTRPLYQQAISALPTQSQTPASGSSPLGQKRTASQRSPSPSGGPPAKRRLADLPDRPRAMRDDKANPANVSAAARGTRLKTSLLDRVGPKAAANGLDPVQERIRSVTQRSMAPGPNVHNPHVVPNGPGGFNGPMDPNAMAMMMQPGFNPAMMNGGYPGGLEATMMAIQQFGQLAMQMGLVGGPMGMMGHAPMPGQSGYRNGGEGYRGEAGRNGAGMGRNGNGPNHNGAQRAPGASSILQAAGKSSNNPSVIAPTPITATAAPVVPHSPPRPSSPTLCKFVTNCTNPTCRYSHPSPVATMESGVVLSTEPCEKGVDCTDKDCIYAHVSKAAVAAAKSGIAPAPAPTSTFTSVSQVACKFDPSCSRPNCPYLHPSRKHHGKPNHALSSTACRFGSACTKADCAYGHPPDRVLPGQFSKGLHGAAPSTIKSAGTERETWNKSVDFRTKKVAPVFQKPMVTNGKLDPTVPPFTPSAVPGSDGAGTEVKKVIDVVQAS